MRRAITLTCALVAGLAVACGADGAGSVAPTAATTMAPAATREPGPAPSATPAPTLARATASVRPSPPSAAAPGTPATVTRVVDGDTIDVEIGGTIERVRLILVDTPEVFGGTDCFGPEASAYMASLLPVGTPVTLERDVSERDRYGRLLRYVYLTDGRMANELLIAGGYATVATFPPDVAYVDRMRALQSSAREAGRGLWSACPTDGVAVPGRAATVPAVATTAGGACDPSYPDVCIPVGAADYDCAGGSGNGPNYIIGPIRVLPPDPHRLDGNHDGWACG